MLFVRLCILLRVRILVPPDNLLDCRWLRAKTLALCGQHDKSRTHHHRDECGHYRHGDHASLNALIMLALLANMLRSDVLCKRRIAKMRRCGRASRNRHSSYLASREKRLLAAASRYIAPQRFRIAEWQATVLIFRYLLDTR